MTDIIDRIDELVACCQCGCGELAPIATRNRPERGIRKGEPMRYIASHSGRARTKLAMPTEQRFWTHVDKTAECWLWTSTTDGNGYGRFRHGSRSTGETVVQAHVFAYELAHGPVPEGLELDHLCRVHGCVRPNHLEPVTHRVNVRRGVAPAGVNSRKTHCPNNHPYDEQNTRWRPRTAKGTMYRACARCERDRSRRRRRDAR